MLAEIRLERDAPVWRHPIDCASLGWVCPERELGVLGERAVTRQFEIEQIVDQGVAAEAYNTLRECTLDKGAGGRGRGQIGADEGEAPDRRRIPDVLHRRVIVERQTPQQVVTLDLGRMGKSNIGIVHSEPAVDPAVSTLDESSNIVRNPAA